jgi:hypothetical protein
MFRPGGAVTRPELAVLLHRYAVLSGRAGEPPADPVPFADESAVPGWASVSVAWARAVGLVNGRPGNIFDPSGAATRAEAAAMLHRYAGIFAPAETPAAGLTDAPPEGGAGR